MSPNQDRLLHSLYTSHFAPFLPSRIGAEVWLLYSLGVRILYKKQKLENNRNI